MIFLGLSDSFYVYYTSKQYAPFWYLVIFTEGWWKFACCLGVDVIDLRINQEMILISNRKQEKGTDCNTDHYLVVAKVRRRFAVNKQTPLKFDVERFNIMKLRKLQDRKQ